VGGRWRERAPLRFFLAGVVAWIVMMGVGGGLLGAAADPDGGPARQPEAAIGGTTLGLGCLLIVIVVCLGAKDLFVFVGRKAGVAGRGSTAFPGSAGYGQSTGYGASAPPRASAPRSEVRNRFRSAQRAAQAAWAAQQTARQGVQKQAGPEPQQAQQTAGAPANRKVTIFMLGFQSSGKTLMLAALYHCFGFGNAPGITLIPSQGAERELSALTREIQDTDIGYLPPGTGLGDTREWKFAVRVGWEHARADAFDLGYVDYAGEHAENLLNAKPDDPVDPRFYDQLGKADILMGVLDGGKICRLMTDGYDTRLAVEIQRLLRLLVLAEQKSVHLVISKWDLLTDRQRGRHYRLSEVVKKLEDLSPEFREFRANPRFTSMRIIPVSALGTDFVQPSPDGAVMHKIPGARWVPENATVPFYCSIPDIISNDIDRMTAHSAGTDGRQGMRSMLSARQLAWATLAALTIAEITFTATGHGITLAIPISKIAGRIREALEKPRRKDRPQRYDQDAALAHVLKACYENMDAFEQEWRLTGPQQQWGR
jgi:hypothetical protein